MNFFLRFAIVWFSALTFFLNSQLEVSAIKEATVTVSLRGNEEEESFLHRGEKKSLAFIDLRADGGKIDIQRISVKLIGTAHTDDIRRATLYTEWGTFLSGASLNEDSLSFSNLGDVSLKDGESQTLILEIEVGATARVGKTLGFQLIDENAVHVESQKYDIKYVELGSSLKTQKFTFLPLDSSAIILASSNPLPSKGMQGGAKTIFGTFSLGAVGKDDIEITEFSVRATGALSSEYISDIALITPDGDILAENPIIKDGKIIFEGPFFISAGSSFMFNLSLFASSSAKTGDNLFFEIPNSWDIVAKTSSSNDSLNIVGEFPLHSNKKIVQTSGLELTLSSQNPPARVVMPREKNVSLLEFVTNSKTETVSLSNLTFQLVGSGTSALQNIRLQKDGEDFIPISQTAKEILFQDLGLQYPEKKSIFTLLADVSPAGMWGNTVSARISASSSVNVTSEKEKNISIAGKFPLSGNAITLGQPNAEKSISVDVQLASKSIPEGTSGASLAYITFSAPQKSAEVQNIKLRLLGTLPSRTLKNMRLINQKGVVVSGPVDVQENIVEFKHPFPLPEGASQKVTLVADTPKTNQKQTIAVQLAIPPMAISLQTAQPIPIIGSYPISTPFLSVFPLPDSPFVKYSSSIISSKTVKREEKDVYWGEIVFSAHHQDVRIDRLLLLERGNIGDGLTNIRLIDSSSGQEYLGKRTDTSYVFEQPIRLSKNTSLSLSLFADIRVTALMGSTFSFKITDSAQILASVKGESISVFGESPLVGSIFSVHDTKDICSSSPEPICGRVYQSCGVSPCFPISKTYRSACELQESNAVFVANGMCSRFGADEYIPPSDKTKDITSREVTLDSFFDVSPAHQNATAIESLRSKGIVKGFSNGSFQAESEISRAAFTKIVIGAQYSDADIQNCLSDNGKYQSQTAFFPDVPTKEWFAPYVCIAKTKGIINGFPNGSFQPGKSVSFAEAAKIVAIAFGSSQKSAPVWYEPYIHFLADKKAIPETVPGLVNNITRGEMAEIIYRLKEKVLNKTSKSADFYLK